MYQMQAQDQEGTFGERTCKEPEEETGTMWQPEGRPLGREDRETRCKAAYGRAKLPCSWIGKQTEEQ